MLSNKVDYFGIYNPFCDSKVDYSMFYVLCSLGHSFSFEWASTLMTAAAFFWGWHCSSCCGWECYYPLEPGQEHSLVCFRSDSCGKKNYGKKLKSIGIYCIKTDDVFWSFNILYSQSQSSVSLKSLSSLLLHPILRNLNSPFGIHQSNPYHAHMDYA